MLSSAGLLWNSASIIWSFLYRLLIMVLDYHSRQLMNSRGPDSKDKTRRTDGSKGFRLKFEPQNNPDLIILLHKLLSADYWMD